MDQAYLGKYSNKKRSKFRGIWHEALGPPPPPSCPIFQKKKSTPIFLEIESMIAKTNFILCPIEKFICFVQL